ncbi:MAG: YggS family pyridoxal phosphate-dependent enzyme [Micropepsaceae bacterium]
MSTQIPAGSIAANLEGVRVRLRKAALVANRKELDVKLIAVSKTHGAETVNEAIEAGQTIFGENRVQEAAAKFPAITAGKPSIELHLIGPLQSNKVRDAVALFDVIHTLDRDSLADALAREMKKSQRKPRLLVQVNTGEEPQKAGIAPQDTPAFLERCRDHWGLMIDGLMCIPPVEDEPALHFALLLKLARDAGVKELSMGMSGDFETAIAFGATYVRVGSAIFGERAPTVSGAIPE